MKAVLLEATEQLTLIERDIPPCAPGEVLIKTRACGICRTDMKCYTQGQRDLIMPRVLGHEISGTVAAVGQGVTSISVGSSVQVAPGIPCGTCSYCLKGQDNLCDSVQILGFHMDGGFAEYVMVPAQGVKSGVLQLIPKHLSFSEAALTEPLACSVNMHNSLNIAAEDTLLIIGAGPLGILNAKLARSKGVRKIILAEINEKRLKYAENYDHDYLINLNKTDLAREINQITQGVGVNTCIPCCPGIEPFSQGINVLAKRGRLGFFSGLIGSSLPLGFDLNHIHYKELLLAGAYGCSISHNQVALRLMAEDKVRVKDMITRRLSLKEVQSGIDMVRNMSEISILIEYTV